MQRIVSHQQESHRAPGHLVRMKALILDIEGTTTPISFVTEILFPYAQKEYGSYISRNWNEESFASYKAAFAQEDAKIVESPESLTDFVLAKHAKNEKHTAFKSLQGAIWKAGYADGSIKATVYNDVPRAIDRVRASGGSVYIYSSGSIPAQKLLFGYSDQGDLTTKLSGYFDTSTAGSKLSTDSYGKISQSIQTAPNDCLFLSDNVKEVDAAKEAGMESWVVERPGNAELSSKDREKNKIIKTFDEVPI